MRALILFAGLLAAAPAMAETLTLAPISVAEWKGVYGTVETKETVPARARIGGLVAELGVSEGDLVEAGQQIAVIRDDKLNFQIAALDAQIEALQAQMTTAESELERGQALVERGVITVQRLDQLRTSVDVVRGQIVSAQAQRAVIVQQETEGEVLAPSAGRVLTVPVTPGAVILAGEPVAVIGGGGFFLRLSIRNGTQPRWPRPQRSRSPRLARKPQDASPRSIPRSAAGGSWPMSRLKAWTPRSSTLASWSACQWASATHFWCRRRRLPQGRGWIS